MVKSRRENLEIASRRVHRIKPLYVSLHWHLLDNRWWDYIVRYSYSFSASICFVNMATVAEKLRFCPKIWPEGSFAILLVIALPTSAPHDSFLFRGTLRIEVFLCVRIDLLFSNDWIRNLNDCLPSSYINLRLLEI